jgi:ubiquinone/menaquinone biosynthesis C-methylase UbiE
MAYALISNAVFNAQNTSAEVRATLTTGKTESKPSLEGLLESADLGIEVLHPGGLEMTRELAELCRIGKGSMVLDVASGTGASACYLAESFGASVVGIDNSDYMVERARKKAHGRNLGVEFRKGDAHDLPVADGTFDVVISECTTCLLQKQKAIGEMVRVVKPGGRVGIHDICWRGNTPEDVKQRLVQLEQESPETLTGWIRLFEEAGLINVQATDKSNTIHAWSREIRKRLGMAAEVKIFLRVLMKWGLSGLKGVYESERIFESVYTGYGIDVGTKPAMASLKP